jgi:hypothetical protein
MSELVLRKGAAIRAEMNDLLADGDNDMLSSVWTLCPGALLANMRKLAVTLVLNEAAAWDFRYTKKLKSFPLQLLVLVEKPANEVDDERKQVAVLLLETSPCCLLHQSPWSDVPIKFETFFDAELRTVAETGTVPRRLYASLLLLRSKTSLDAQDMEGANSVLQTMAKAAPTLRMALASDRLKIKKGDAISVAECVGLHHLVLHHQNTVQHSDRFVSPCLNDVPAEKQVAPCRHKVTELYVHAVRMSSSMVTHIEVNCGTVWSFSKLSATSSIVVAYVTCWSYYRTVFVAKGTAEIQGGRWVFKLNRPIETMALAEAVMAVDTFSSESKTLPLLRYAAEWTSLCEADLDTNSLRSFRIKPAARAQYHIVAPAGAVPAEAPAAAPLAADDIDMDPLLLEQWMEEVMGDDDDDISGELKSDGAADMLVQEGDVGFDDAPGPVIEASPLPEHILQKLERMAMDGRAELEFVLGRCVACSANPIQDKDPSSSSSSASSSS